MCGARDVCDRQCECLRDTRETEKEGAAAWRQSRNVVDMIACLDLSYGKNKTSISHYLPFNQIPTFFASLPQNCHRLKISPFLIKEPRVQLISRLGEDTYSETLRLTHTRKKGRNAPTSHPPPSPPHQANYF